MKTVLRVITFLLALCLLISLAGTLSMLTTIPWISSFVEVMAVRYAWLRTAFAVGVLFCMAASVLALVLIVSVRPKKNLYVLDRKAGEIEITRQSVEAEANGVLEDMKEVKRYHVQAKGDMRPGKLRLEVQLEPRDDTTDLVALGDSVQQRLAGTMAECLAMKPKHIRVRIHQERPSEAHRGHVKVPRVV